MTLAMRDYVEPRVIENVRSIISSPIAGMVIPKDSKSRKSGPALQHGRAVHGLIKSIERTLVLLT
jgi:hypothetical protein